MRPLRQAFGASPADWAAAAAAVLLLPLAALAQTPEKTTDKAQGGDRAQQARTYRECMDLARTAPETAIARAADWEKKGGGEGARHCGAVALLNAGRYAEAARRLEVLGESSPGRSKALRGELFAQAGQAWLIGGNAERALAAQTRAIETAGPGPELLIDRSITYASLGKYWKAIDDLSAVVDRHPARADALILRATAWRKIGNLELATDDISRAVDIAPGHVDALLERGILRRLDGDKAGARSNWLKVLEIDAASPAADAARENLDRLEKSG